MTSQYFLFLPGNRLREDLHARPITGIGPSGMYYSIGTGDQLSIVAKETAARKANAGVKCSVADSHLLRKCVAAIGGFADEILHFGIKRVMAVIVPAHVDRAIRSRRRPGEEVIFAGVKGVIIDTVN